jgi:intracellular sulfur oxidation DsrE/DsrF family protein
LFISRRSPLIITDTLPGREIEMKTKSGVLLITVLIFTVCVLLSSVSNASSDEYVALKGLKSVKAVFDFRIGDPKNAAAHLKLIHQTYKDESIKSVTDKPDFVVVYIGHSAKVVSKNREGYSPEEQKTLDEIAGIISEMSKDGIRMEICLFAAQSLGVDASSILPEIKHVGNGWISVIAYQSKDYSLVAAF